MEIKYTLEILTKDIQDIGKLVENLQNSQDGSTLELDLALSKLRNVYDILTVIREDIRKPVQVAVKVPEAITTPAPMVEIPRPEPKPEPVVQTPQPESVVQATQPEPEPIAQAPKPEPVPTPTMPEPVAKTPESEPEPVAAPIKPEPAMETPKPEPEPEPKPVTETPKPEPEPVTETPKPEPEPEPGPVAQSPGPVHGKNPAIIAEKFASESSINENLAGNREPNMDSKLMGQPIDHIGRNIGINDRFLIIRELFNGDSDGFAKLIQDLDGAGSLQNATERLQYQFSNAPDHEGITILDHLVKRKYSKS